MKITKLLYGVFSLIFILKILETMSFIDYYDPFAYHLAMPRIWYETSFMEALKENDLFILAGLFDYLYIIPMYLTGGDLFTTQKVSQFLHFFFGLGLSSILLIKIFKNKTIGLLAGITLLTISKGSTFFLVAKNDGPLALLVLLCFLMIFDEKVFKKLEGPTRAAFIGLLMGLIPTVKLNGLLYLVPISVYFVIKYRREIKSILICSAISILVLLPTLIKNWILIKNPLFPALLGKIPGESTSQMRLFYSKFVGSDFQIDLLMQHFSYFLLGKALFILVLPILIYKIYKKDINKNYIPVLLAASSYFIYVIINGGLPTYRFVFPGYFLICFFIFKEIEDRPIFQNKTWLVLILLIFALVDSKLDKSIKAAKKMSANWNSSNKEIVNREFSYSQFWNYIEPEGKTYIASDYLTNSYFSKKGTRVNCALVDRMAEDLMTCKKPETLNKFSYALLRENGINDCYKSIEENGIALHRINGITLYDIRKINFK